MDTEIQIYCRKPSLGEVQQLLRIGVRYVAWHVDPQDGSALVQSRMIADFVRNHGARSSLLVHSRKPSVLEAVGKMVAPSYLLMSSDRDDSAMPALSESLKPHTSLMMSVPVRPAGTSICIQSVALAKTYQQFSGMLILDTCPSLESQGSFGCTGRTNDWEICAEIVSSATCPVILAGGLSSGNVATAISAVRPFGVDACTSLELADKSKNLMACEEFVHVVQSV